jgi:hypothetical protein
MYKQYLHNVPIRSLFLFQYFFVVHNINMDESLNDMEMSENDDGDCDGKEGDRTE